MAASEKSFNLAAVKAELEGARGAVDAVEEGAQGARELREPGEVAPGAMSSALAAGRGSWPVGAEEREGEGAS